MVSARKKEDGSARPSVPLLSAYLRLNEDGTLWRQLLIVLVCGLPKKQQEDPELVHQNQLP